VVRSIAGSSAGGQSDLPVAYGRQALRYNTAGADGVRDVRRRARASHALLSEERRIALRPALAGPQPADDQWGSRMVAARMSARLGRAVRRQSVRRLLRKVATAFPQATVERWTVNEHRIGFEPVLHTVWCVDGQRPLAPGQPRYEWRF
jgi:hypothetical protein